MLDRLDAWIVIFLFGALFIGFMIDQQITILRLRKTNKYLLRKINETRRDSANASRQFDAEISNMKSMWSEDVDLLKSEIAKKDKLLNQKWNAVKANESA